MTQDYSFSVGVPLHLPEGKLSKDQQAELIELVREKALETTKNFVASLDATPGPVWTLHVMVKNANDSRYWEKSTPVEFTEPFSEHELLRLADKETRKFIKKFSQEV